MIDTRLKINQQLLDKARVLNIKVELGVTPISASGSNKIKNFKFKDKDGLLKQVHCDVLAMSGGFNPTVHLYSQAGGTLLYDTEKACFVPDKCRQRVVVSGSANGNFATKEHYNIGIRKASPAKSKSQWIDYVHDVTVADIELACHENLHSVEHVKRYTTTGMAIDQGKTSNLNALTLLGQLTDRDPGEVGTTTFRPMFMPVTMGAIAGIRNSNFYMPARRLPAHDWHKSHGAVFEDYGGWDRPAYYGQNRNQCIWNESLNVRKTVGLYDGSPLGKIEVKGPDAAEFLNRIYLNTVPTLKIGKVRYGLMLDENGVVFDDGVFIKLAEEHYLINTTSAHADRISGWLEEWHQCEWPDLDLVMIPVTSQWAVVNLAGPKSRDVLSELSGIQDLSTEVFPHMSFSQGEFNDGTPYRLQRVSFTGELSYELSVPARNATQFFERLWEIGKDYDMCLFGAESLMILRLEKGFIHVGGDTDGVTNPLDAGFGRIVHNKKTDFIGARSLQRPEDMSQNRRQLIGFEVKNKKDHVQPGAHIVIGNKNDRRSEGFVTSAAMSPTLEKTVGLGLLERGFSRMNEEIRLFDEGKEVIARIVEPCFYDKDGERMRG